MTTQQGVEVTAADELPYLDRIWSLKSLLFRVRGRVLQLHRGLFEYEELTAETLAKLSSSGLDEQQGLQLLARFCRRVNDAPGRHLEGGLSAAWKNSLLQQLLQEQVGPACRHTCPAVGIPHAYASIMFHPGKFLAEHCQLAYCGGMFKQAVAKAAHDGRQAVGKAAKR
jgi:hypothetical protein